MKKKLFSAFLCVFVGVLFLFCAAACSEKNSCEHTLRERGYADDRHWSVCDRCERYYDEGAHTPENGVCTVCGFVVDYTKGLQYSLYNDEYTVTGYGEAQDRDVVIPSYYQNLPVTEIGADAFGNNTKMQSVKIPATVTEVGVSAFNGCSALTDVAMGKNVSAIGEGAFQGTALVHIEIPQGVTEIQNSTFANCAQLTLVSLPKTVTAIGVSAFQYCENLEEVQIEAGGVIISLQERAFIGCKKLKSMRFDEGLLCVEKDAFVNCTSLGDLVFPQSLQTIPEGAFAGCSSVQKIVFGEGLREIGYGAFGNCAALQEISLPADFQTLADQSFTFCNALTKINFAGTLAQWRALEKHEGWNGDIYTEHTYTLVCSDGAYEYRD